MVCLALCYHVTLPVEKCPDAACHLQIFLILGGSFVSIFGRHPELSIDDAVQLVQMIAETEKLHTTVDPQALWKAYGMQEPDLKRNILRGEMAVMIDQVLDPFNKKQIDITGKYIQ